MDYGNILKKTWQAIWGHKAILGFGLAMTLVPGLFAMLLVGFFFFSPWFGIGQIDQWINGNSFILIGLSVVFALVSIVSTSIGYAGILKGTSQAEQGVEQIGFLDLWNGSWPYALRILGITLLIGTGLSLLVLIPALLGFVTNGLGFLCFTPFMCLVVPVSILGRLFMDLGMPAVVADDLGLFAAFGRAWRVIRENMGAVFVMGLILYLIQMGLTTVLYLPLNYVPSLLILPLARSSASPETTFRTLVIFMLAVMPFALVIQGALQTYLQSAWMQFYLQLKPSPDEMLQSVHPQE